MPPKKQKKSKGRKKGTGNGTQPLIFSSLKDSWATCPPNELSNLFYFRRTTINKTQEIEKYSSIYMLEKAGINKLVKLQHIKTIRIYMGCGPLTIEGYTNDSTFYPILATVKDGGEEDYFSFTYEPTYPNWTDIPISGEIAGLFRTHWNQLSDDGIANAFSGLTVDKYSKSDLSSVGSLRTRRVKFYEFPYADVIEIQKQLRNNPSEQQALALMLGAGLTVRITHPFNFRPILAVPKTKKKKKTKKIHSFPSKGDTDTTGIAYFERSQPCPPYCPNGDTSELTH